VTCVFWCDVDLEHLNSASLVGYPPYLTRFFQEVMHSNPEIEYCKVRPLNLLMLVAGSLAIRHFILRQGIW
jgi:hypothetical protein